MKSINLKSIKSSMENICYFAKEAFDDYNDIRKYAIDNIHGFEFSQYIQEGFKDEVINFYKKMNKENTKVYLMDFLKKNVLTSKDFAEYIIFNGVNVDYGFDYSYDKYLKEDIFDGLMNITINDKIPNEEF